MKFEDVLLNTGGFSNVLFFGISYFFKKANLLFVLVILLFIGFWDIIGKLFEFMFVKLLLLGIKLVLMGFDDLKFDIGGYIKDWASRLLDVEGFEGIIGMFGMIGSFNLVREKIGRL